MSEFQCTCSSFCAILYLKTCCATQGEIIILQSWYDLSLSINAREKIYHESKYSWTEFQFQDKCVNHKFYCVTEKRQEDGKTTRIKIQFLNGLYYMPLKFISKSHTHTHIYGEKRSHSSLFVSHYSFSIPVYLIERDESSELLLNSQTIIFPLLSSVHLSTFAKQNHSHAPPTLY